MPVSILQDGGIGASQKMRKKIEATFTDENYYKVGK